MSRSGPGRRPSAGDHSMAGGRTAPAETSASSAATRACARRRAPRGLRRSARRAPASAAGRTRSVRHELQPEFRAQPAQHVVVGRDELAARARRPCRRAAPGTTSGRPRGRALEDDHLDAGLVQPPRAVQAREAGADYDDRVWVGCHGGHLQAGGGRYKGRPVASWVRAVVTSTPAAAPWRRSASVPARAARLVSPTMSAEASCRRSPPASVWSTTASARRRRSPAPTGGCSSAPRSSPVDGGIIRASVRTTWSRMGSPTPRCRGRRPAPRSGSRRVAAFR